MKEQPPTQPLALHRRSRSYSNFGLLVTSFYSIKLKINWKSAKSGWILRKKGESGKLQRMRLLAASGPHLGAAIESCRLRPFWRDRSSAKDLLLCGCSARLVVRSTIAISVAADVDSFICILTNWWSGRVAVLPPSLNRVSSERFKGVSWLLCCVIVMQLPRETQPPSRDADDPLSASRQQQQQQSQQQQQPTQSHLVIPKHEEPYHHNNNNHNGTDVSHWLVPFTCLPTCKWGHLNADRPRVGRRHLHAVVTGHRSSFDPKSSHCHPTRSFLSIEAIALTCPLVAAVAF